MTRDELELLDALLDERLPPGQRTAAVPLWALGYADVEKVDRLLQRLSMRGLIDYLAPLDPDGSAIISRRRPAAGMPVKKAKKPRTAMERAQYGTAPRGA